MPYNATHIIDAKTAYNNNNNNNNKLKINEKSLICQIKANEIPLTLGNGSNKSLRATKTINMIPVEIKPTSYIT